MKKIIALILLIITVESCEDVIDITLPNAKPKLVIEASINWFDGTAGNEQEVILTLSAPYFDAIVPPVNNAIVSIINSDNVIFNFLEQGNSGVYKTTTFIPKINQTYRLKIIYDGNTYTATETLKTVTPINSIEQNNESGFSGKETEIKVFYTDTINEENYYLYEFITNTTAIPTLEVYNDEFTNGNEIFAFYTEEDLQTGDQLMIRNYGISKRFYDYMFILLQQSSDGNGGPFQTQPATVRGNCINETQPENFPLGFFRLSQAHEFIYNVE